MFISAFQGVKALQTLRNRGPQLSTEPCQLYVSYLTTRELVACVERIDDKLSTPGVRLTNTERELLRGIRADLLRELGRRQLSLFEPAERN